MRAGFRGARRVDRAAPRWLAIGCAVVLLASSAAPAAAAEPDAREETAPAAATPASSWKFRSPEDGWFDLSGFLDTTYGFVPLVVPITEPAVGYGAAAALVFIDRSQGAARAGFDRPNVTAIGGLATENDTWGVFAGDVRHWGDNRVQTLAGILDASINLDFYGVGEAGALNDDPLTYTLEPLGGGARAKYRFGDSRLWAGLTYVLADTRVAFEDPASADALLEAPGDSRVGGLVPMLAFDSRDNLFTPTRGVFLEGSVGVFDEALGGDGSFQRLSLVYIHYLALRPGLTFGVRGQAAFSFGDVPFYLLPYVSLRGAPVLRYQGEDAADLEAEVCWRFWKRFSLVGFAGVGAAWNDFESVDETITLATGGTGFRYELARKYGIHAGLDVAFGPDETAIYIQFGSAWARP